MFFQRKFPIGFLYFFAGLCLLTQFSKSVDLQGYLAVVRDCWAQSFTVLRYPVGDLPQGAYFQSPVTTWLLVPFALLPLVTAKFLWGVGCLVGFFAMVRRLLPHPIPMASGIFLTAIFVYPLSDVFLSGNTGFPMILFLYFGWEWIAEKGWKRFAAPLIIALAIWIKPVGVIALAWIFYFKGMRPLLHVIFSCIASAAATFVLMGIPLASSWWSAWWKALPYYALAGHPGRDAFQSPPAAVFRMLLDFTNLSFDQKLLVANIVGLLLVAALFLWTYRQQKEPLCTLLTALYVCTPFAWACTILSLFPLLAVAVRQEPPPRALLLTSCLFAFAQKAFLPSSFWDYAIHHNLHAWFLIVFMVFGLKRLKISTPLLILPASH